MDAGSFVMETMWIKGWWRGKDRFCGHALRNIGAQYGVITHKIAIVVHHCNLQDSFLVSRGERRVSILSVVFVVVVATQSLPLLVKVCYKWRCG